MQRRLLRRTGYATLHFRCAVYSYCVSFDSNRRQRGSMHRRWRTINPSSSRSALSLTDQAVRKDIKELRASSKLPAIRYLLHIFHAICYTLVNMFRKTCTCSMLSIIFYNVAIVALSALFFTSSFAFLFIFSITLSALTLMLLSIWTRYVFIPF